MEEPAVADEESHEDIWSSMPTVVVRDSAPQPRVQVRMAVDATSDSSDDSDTDSSTSASDGAGWGRHGGVAAPSSTSTGPGLDTSGDDDALTLRDLTGGAEDDVADTDLPSLEQERQRLDAIVQRRDVIQSIVSKYSPSVPRDRAVAEEPSRQLATVEAVAVSEVGATGSAVDATKAGEVWFSSLDALEGCAGSLTPEAPCITYASSKYVVAAEVESRKNMDCETVLDDDGGNGAECKDVHTAECTGRNKPRPWEPTTRPIQGPSAPVPGKVQMQEMLGRLGARFRDRHDAMQGTFMAGAIETTDDIIRELGARVGDIGDGVSDDRRHCPTVSQASKLPPLAVGSADSNTGQVGPETPKTGALVVLSGLSREELNGQLARVLKMNSGVKPGRLPVRVEDSGQELSIRIENLKKATQAATPEVPAAAPEPREQDKATVDAALDKLRDLRGADLDEALLRSDLWEQCLAGDDRLVGDDALPPPELYYGKRAAEGK